MPQFLRRPIHRSLLVIQGRDVQGRIMQDLRSRTFQTKSGFASFRQLNRNCVDFMHRQGLTVSFYRERGL
jgi:hypothetical protein